MSWPIKLRATSPLAARHKGFANKLGGALHTLSAGTATRTSLYDGFVFKARKNSGRVLVDVVEIPGRFVGSNQYRAGLDGLIGESTIDGIVVSTAPNNLRMSPTGPTVEEVNTEEREGAIGSAHAFGDPLPEDPFLLYNSFPCEIDGGVIFVHLYTTTQPPVDGAGAFIVIDQPVWLAVMVKWAGAGPKRSVTFSEAYIQGLTGMGFYPRHVVYEGSSLSPIRYGARLPVAHYQNNRLSVAIELESPGGGVSTVGGLLAVGVAYADGEALIEWSSVTGPNDVDSDLQSDVFTSDDLGAYRSAGFDLPAIFSWLDNSGLEPAHKVLVSFRARCRKAVTDAYRLNTGQVLLSVVNGVVSSETSFLDSISGADSGLPQIEAERVFVQKYRDDFFLDAANLPVRHRRMRVLDRPADDDSIIPAAPTTLAIHADIALLRTESVAGTVEQTQGALGYGPEEVPAGSTTGNGTSGIENIGFSTPVSVGEVWGWGFINDTGASQIGIARITASGVAAPLAAGIPRSLKLSTYQREVLDSEGAVLTPMAQVATILDLGSSKIAIKKGRFGAMDFVDAASYSRFNTFYLATPASIPRYGRIFG